MIGFLKNSRATRLLIYSLVIILLAVELLFSPLQKSFDWVVQKRFAHLSQWSLFEYKNWWMGVPVFQYANDLVLYENIIRLQKPEVIIETGTHYGGLAVFLSSVIEMYHMDTVIISIDITDEAWKSTLADQNFPEHLLERIQFVKGDSVSDDTLAIVAELANGKKGLVILDSLHTADHVLKELQVYQNFVGPGGYLIVNDTQQDFLEGGGPKAAIESFLKGNEQFDIDERLPLHWQSCSHEGFLKRKHNDR